MATPAHPTVLQPHRYLGGLKQPADAPALPDGTWYETMAPGDGLTFSLSVGSLADAEAIAADFLVDSNTLLVLDLKLYEGEDDDGPAFLYSFNLLHQCQVRMRLRIASMDNNAWLLPREAGLGKPRCGGAVIDPAKVGYASLTVCRKAPGPVRFCMTPLAAYREAPPTLDRPLLPKGRLVDELGQCKLRHWPTKTRGEAELVERLQQQHADADEATWPDAFTKWGGWKQKRFDATGYYRTQFDDGAKRWWLVDPDGHAFWSTGPDCVRTGTATPTTGLESAYDWLPDASGRFDDAIAKPGSNRPGVTFDIANFIRAFGPDDWFDKWKSITRSLLRRFGFNTLANWNDPRMTREGDYPYLFPLRTSFERTPMIFRDLPDVFADTFERDAEAFAQQLVPFKGDRWLIGYFLMNEPTWGFAEQCVAEGMLVNTSECATRRELVAWLKRERYADEAALQSAWGEDVTFECIERGAWRGHFSDQAKNDLADFSAIICDRFFGALTRACRTIDPNHLNLGCRYYTEPPAWVMPSMKHFDVFSMNSYTDGAPLERMARIEGQLGVPILIGEWHFGALDVGLPASGIGHVPTQRDRGKAYRVYLEGAAASPHCVGAHYFQWNDQPVLGRFDGENYQIGCLDVCHRPYDELLDAARASHERLYDVASGKVKPFDESVKYLPRLF